MCQTCASFGQSACLEHRQPPALPRVMTATDYANHRGLNPATVRRWAIQGRIVKVGERKYLTGQYRAGRIAYLYLTADLDRVWNEPRLPWGSARKEGPRQRMVGPRVPPGTRTGEPRGPRPLPSYRQV